MVLGTRFERRSEEVERCGRIAELAQMTCFRCGFYLEFAANVVVSDGLTYAVCKESEEHPPVQVYV